MRILIAPDKFKGTLSASEAVQAITSRLQKLEPTWGCLRCPLADGGEGTLDAALPPGGSLLCVETFDARNRPLQASYGHFTSQDLPTVLVESASCLGLSHLPADLHDPEQATSFGLGLLVRTALQQNPKRVVVALGGVATVDGGLGFLQALGARFETGQGPLTGQATAASLRAITRADLSPAVSLFQGIELEAWCDVMSPLLGPTGATQMFGPQKGATPEAVIRLERGMGSFVSVLEKSFDSPLREIPGAGAAGGMGMAIATLSGGLRSGFSAIAESVGLEEQIKSCDIVVTGEGRLDASTRQGKAPWGVLELARHLGKPCYVVAGSVTDTTKEWNGTVSLFDDDVKSNDPRLKDLDAAWDRAVRRLHELIEPKPHNIGSQAEPNP